MKKNIIQIAHVICDKTNYYMSLLYLCSPNYLIFIISPHPLLSAEHGIYVYGKKSAANRAADFLPFAAF